MPGPGSAGFVQGCDVRELQNLISLGLDGSMPDPISFLEQRKEPWDTKRKKRVSVHPAISSHGTQCLWPKPGTEDSFYWEDVEDVAMRIFT